MKELNRIRLNGLRALEIAGRLGSLQAAAHELGVTPGAVSQQIIRAEQELGRTVFHRTPRGLVLTEFGRVLHAHLAAGFRELALGAALAQRRSNEVLTISVAPVLAAKWLVPRLTRYRDAHPNVRVRIEASVEMADLNGSDVDLAIRIAPGPGEDVDGELLIHQEVFPVCTPELAARLRTPRDLLAVPLLVDAYSRVTWDDWLAVVGLAGKPLCIGYTYADAGLCLDAAIAGQGMMLGWQTLAADALESGRLVAPFRERARTDYGYWVVTGRHRAPSPQVAGFKAWLRDEMARTAACFEPS
jgi:LysR family transcriptional regulator, glycine cleavage system transcriptional activator